MIAACPAAISSNLSARVSAAVNEADADLPFQAVDLPGEGRLGSVQRLGGAAEVAVLGHGGERLNKPQFEFRGRLNERDRKASTGLST
jgi:hypothetical protein